MANKLSRRYFIQESITASMGLMVMSPVLSTFEAKSIVLARKGRAMARILLPAAPSPAEQFAGNELATYLFKITGAKFVVQSSKENAHREALIIIGKGAEDLGPEGFRITSQDNNVLLTGFDDAGVEFAVYTFLEKYLGVRWLWPGELGEVVPKKTSLSIGSIQEAQKPDFLWRNRGPAGALWGATTGPTEMHARELLMGVTKEHQQQVQLWEKRNKWGGWKVYGGHNIAEIFPPQKYASSHPEYYAWVKGKRAVPGPDFDYKHGGQVCTTEPGVLATTVEWVNQFYDNHPEYQGVHISMNDSGGFCECDRCRALDSGKMMGGGGIDAQETKGEASRRAIITDRIFTFANQVAEQVQKRHPGKYIFCFAYGPMILPPEKIQLHPNVVPQYTLWSAYKHSDPKLKQEHDSLAAAWAKRGKHIGIYEYHINGSWPGMHRLAVANFAENIRFLRQQGIRLYQTQAGDGFSTNGPNYYVTGKLLWNTSENENQILSDFFEKGFGRSAPVMRSFHERMEKAWADATRGGHDVTCNSIKDQGLAELFNEELMKRCTSDLDEAWKTAETETIRKRVEFYQKGLQYTQLTVDAVAAAKALVTNPTRQLVEAALAAITRRQKFAEDLKNDYVLPYFWFRYNNEQRNFLPSIEKLQALLKTVSG
jgi:hypothetical protein